MNWTGVAVMPTPRLVDGDALANPTLLCAGDGINPASTTVAGDGVVRRGACSITCPHRHGAAWGDNTSLRPGFLPAACFGCSDSGSSPDALPMWVTRAPCSAHVRVPTYIAPTRSSPACPPWPGVVASHCTHALQVPRAARLSWPSVRSYVLHSPQSGARAAALLTPSGCTPPPPRPSPDSHDCVPAVRTFAVCTHSLHSLAVRTAIAGPVHVRVPRAVADTAGSGRCSGFGGHAAAHHAVSHEWLGTVDAARTGPGRSGGCEPAAAAHARYSGCVGDPPTRRGIRRVPGPRAGGKRRRGCRGGRHLSAGHSNGRGASAAVHWRGVASFVCSGNAACGAPQRRCTQSGGGWDHRRRRVGGGQSQRCGGACRHGPGRVHTGAGPLSVRGAYVHVCNVRAVVACQLDGV